VLACCRSRQRWLDVQLVGGADADCVNIALPQELVIVGITVDTERCTDLLQSYLVYIGDGDQLARLTPTRSLLLILDLLRVR
jgi:hypothetical protein